MSSWRPRPLHSAEDKAKREEIEARNQLDSLVYQMEKMLKENSLQEDAHLRPGDMVFVPQNSLSKIARFLTKPALSMYLNPTQF